MAVEDRAEGVGEVVDGVHARHFACCDQRGEHGPVLGADLVAREERVFPRQGNWSDLIFDGVCVQLEGAVLEEADQASPVRQGVADVLGQLGFLRDARELSFQPRLERSDDRG